MHSFVLRFFTRHLRSNKFMTAISVLGLAVGMAAAMLITLFVRHELSFDAFHPHRDRLVLVTDRARFSGAQEFATPFASAPMAVAFKHEIDAVEDYCRLDLNSGDIPIKVGERRGVNQGLIYADSSFFSLFGFTLAQGSPSEALAAPNSVVLSPAMAENYFGSEDPVGKTITFWSSRDYTVTGVLNPPPGPTHLGNISFICSWTSRKIDDTQSWLNNVNYPTYLLLKPGTDLRTVVDAMNASAQEHMGEVLKQIGAEWTFDLMPVQDIHLHGAFDFETFTTGSLTYVIQFAAIGLFILLIATLNYINLTTARATRRGKMVGIAKSLGASRSQLIRQFLVESVLVSLLAFAIALLLMRLALPLFNRLLGVDLAFLSLHQPGLPLILLGVSVGVGLLAGLYPALMISAFPPAAVVRGQLSSGRAAVRLRSGLVILQFAISVVLIIGALVVMRQLNYMRNLDLGYDKEHVLTIHLPNWDLMQKHEALETEIGRLSGVVGIASADQLPNQIHNNSVFHVPGTAAESQLLLAVHHVGFRYLGMMHVPLLEGRDFDPSIASDSSDAVILNQACAEMLGWEHPVGKIIEDYNGESLQETHKLHVIGMVQNYHFESLRTKIRPLMINVYEGSPNYLYFRLAPGSVQQTLPKIETIWKQFSEGQPFQYQFLDQMFDQQYRTELRMGSLFNGFTALAIFIACLGLFALAVFAAEQRTKEIGIRKVLGASEGEIIRLLVLQFLKLVAVANLIAWPVGGYLMQHWLDGFAYRIALGPLWFVLAAAVSLVVALLTVSAQAIRAALANPVKSLRYE